MATKEPEQVPKRLNKELWHRVIPNNKNDKKSQPGICSICGPIKLYFKGKKFACSGRSLDSKGLDKTKYHKISNIDRNIKEPQLGTCSICGQNIHISYDKKSNVYKCQNKANEWLKNKMKDKSYSEHRKKYNQKWSWKNRFGLDQESIEKKFIEQNAKCAICREEISLNTTDKNIAYVDHDHSCCLGGSGINFCGNCNRGLLCRNCNSGIGMLQDSIDILNNAIAYLTSHSK